MKEQDQKKIDAMVELLGDTELSLESFDLQPVTNDSDEIVGMKLVLVSDLIDKLEENDSALTVIENHFINKDYTFKQVLEKLVDSLDELEEE